MSKNMLLFLLLALGAASDLWALGLSPIQQQQQQLLHQSRRAWLQLQASVVVPAALMIPQQPSIATTMNEGDLSDMVAVLTGSTSGFGAAVAKRLAARGATVVIAGRRKAQGLAVAEECQRLGAKNAIFVPVDITQDNSVRNLFDQALKEYGKVSHVFVNAGVFDVGNYVFDDSISGLDRTLATNVKGTTLTARYAFRALQKNADMGDDCALVFTSSAGASMSNGLADILPAGDLTFGLYTASKAYIDALARASTTFYKDSKIRTYTISPAVYNTYGPEELQDDIDLSFVVNSNLKDYAGNPEDVAKVVEAMFDGSTAWQSGSNVGCEGPYTYNIGERYKRMYEPENYGIASPELPLSVFRDVKGRKNRVTKEELKRIHDAARANS